MKLRQETQFPREQATRLVVTCQQPTEFTLKLRHPAWAASRSGSGSGSGPGFTITLNGESLSEESKPGSYAEIKRLWKTGDVVEVAFPFRLHTEGFHDNPNRLAFLHGPVVLCGAVDPASPVPVIVADPGKLLGAVEAVAGQDSTFTALPELFQTPGTAHASRAVTLEPLYAMHGQRHYAVYWDLLTPAEWQAWQAEAAAEQARHEDLVRQTVDFVDPAQSESERDHRLESEKSARGTFNDRGWRHAVDGGWFRYEVKVSPGQKELLVVTYWSGESGGRAFDVVVDGRKLASETSESNRPGMFYDQSYPLPPELTKGKNHVMVTFQARFRRMAGRVFGVRVVRVP